MIAVTNTVGSSLAREADGVLYTHAGPEIGVAATKTFATQMVSQYLVALYLAQVRGSMFPEEIAEVLPSSTSCPRKVAARDRARRPGAASSPSATATRATCCSSGGTRGIRRRSRAR